MVTAVGVVKIVEIYGNRRGFQRRRTQAADATVGPLRLVCRVKECYRTRARIERPRSRAFSVRILFGQGHVTFFAGLQRIPFQELLHASRHEDLRVVATPATLRRIEIDLGFTPLADLQT
jgi:hypothetical protein